MAGLPKGLLKEVIKEGYDPPEAMKEAWKRVKVQKQRYAARMSHGGGYPLGYKGRNPAQTLSEWEEHWKLEAVRQKTGRTYIPGAYRLERRAEKELYNLSDFIVSSNVAGTIWLIPRKNPALKFKDLKEGDAFVFESEETMPFSGMALGPWIKFDNRTYYKSKALSPGQIRHLIKVGSINVKVIKTGEMVNPKISFSKWLTAVEREFDLADVHPKWSGFTAKKLYKVYSPKKAAEVLILESKRRKNPVMSGTFAGIVDNPVIISSKDEALHLAARLKQSLSDYPFVHVYISTLGGEARTSILITVSLDPKSEWPNGILENSRYAKFHLGYDGKLEMITGYKVGKMRKVSVKNIEGASAKLHQFLGQAGNNPHRKKIGKNPIAVFNPGGGTLIYGRVLELRAVKTSGKHRGERYRHTFGPHVQAIGLSNGSVLLKSNNGARLWKSI